MATNIQNVILPHGTRAAKYLHKARKHADRATNPTLSAAQAGASRNCVVKYIHKLKGELSGHGYFKLNVKDVAQQLIQRSTERNKGPKLTIKIPAKHKRALSSPQDVPTSAARTSVASSSRTAPPKVDTTTYRDTPGHISTIIGAVVAPRYRGQYRHSGAQAELAVQDAAEALGEFRFGGETISELDSLASAMQATSLGPHTLAAYHDITRTAYTSFQSSSVPAYQDPSPASSLSSLPEDHTLDAAAELFGNLGSCLAPSAPSTRVQDYDAAQSGPQTTDLFLQSFNCEREGWSSKDVRRADRQTKAAPYSKAARPARFAQFQA